MSDADNWHYRLLRKAVLLDGRAYDFISHDMGQVGELYSEVIADVLETVYTDAGAGFSADQVRDHVFRIVENGLFPEDDEDPHSEN